MARRAGSQGGDEFRRKPLGLLCALLLVVLLSALPARAQETAEHGRLPEIFLVTIGVGRQAHELFGHNALAVYDPATSTGVAYNWGVFDFNQPNFFGRFAMGRMLYTMQGEDLGRMVAGYRSVGRSVTLRRLNLSPEQTRTIVELCEQNDTPGNRDYRYDYYRDNCSTRVRDMIDRATGGAVAAALKAQPAETTYGLETLRLSQTSPAVFGALCVFMGEPTTTPISKWEAAFIPSRLETYLTEVGLATGEGSTTRPLAGEALKVVAEGHVEPAGVPTPQVAAVPALLSAGAAAVLAALGLLVRGLGTKGRGGWILEKLLLLGVLGWTALAGTAGLLIAWLWLFTDHWAAARNLNLLALSPLSAVMVPLAVWLLIKPRATKVAVALARLGVLAVLGVAIQIGLASDFRTTLVTFVTLPLHVGTAVGLALLMKAKLAEGAALPGPVQTVGDGIPPARV